MNEPIRIFEYEDCAEKDSLTGRKYSNELIKYKYGLIKLNSELKKKLKADGDIITVLPGGKLRTSHYVGVLQVNNLRIEILPKLYRQDTDDNKYKVSQALKNLSYMLKYVTNLKIGETPQSIFETGDILEIYISMFLSELENVLQSSIFREYVTVEENLSTVRGKLLLTQHIRSNSVKNLPHAFCQFDELTRDNLLNQTIKYTLRLLRCISQSYDNQRKIEQFLFIFDDVSDVAIHPHHQNKIHFHRLNLQFKHVIDKCFMFIRNFAVDLSSGRFVHGGIIFDMNVLFEEFLGKLLRKNHEEILRKTEFEDCNVHLQSKWEYLVEEPVCFRLIPDIVLIKNEKAELIIDTKYKVLDSSKRYYGVSQEDVYQMFAYLHKFECSRGVLLYPWNEKLSSSERTGIVKPYCFDKTRTLHIATIDLKRDLRVECDRLKKELHEFFRELRAA